MRTRSVLTCAALMSLISLSAFAAEPAEPAAPAARPEAKQGVEVTFKGRVKFDQSNERVMKISVEPEVMPLDSKTLTSILNSPAVAGAAAKDTFKLSEDEYTTYVRLTAEATAKPGYVIARVDVTLRADGRIPTPIVNRFVDSLRKHLEVVLTDSIDADRRNIEKRQDALLNRQNYLEKKYVDVWTNRVRVAEDSGLAERSVDLMRSSVTSLTAALEAVEMDLELRKARAERLAAEIEAAKSSQAPPARDPLADELEKLVRIRARQLESANNAGVTEDDRDAAEARMLDAKLRWIERVDALEKLKPEAQVKDLEKEIADLAVRQRMLGSTLTKKIDMARNLYRYGEHVALLQKQEERIDKAINRVEEQIDELANYSGKLGAISVTIIGQGTP